MHLGGMQLQEIFRKSLPHALGKKAVIREEVGVGKTLIAPQTAAAYDDDEPIFSTVSEQREVCADEPIFSSTHGKSKHFGETETPLYWGLGPVGIRMRCSSPFKMVDIDGSVGAASSRKRLQQQDHGGGEQKLQSASTPSRPAATVPTPSIRFSTPAAIAVGSSPTKRPQQSRAEDAAEDIVPHLLPSRGCLRKPGDPKRRLPKGISWSRGVVTQKKEIKPYKKDGELWYVNGCDIECNICEQVCTQESIRSIRGTAGAPRSAQWQIVCVDCVQKERLAEIGGLQILSFSAGDGGRSLRGYMRKMLQSIKKVAPLRTGNDTLVHLMRVLQDRGLSIEGCPDDATEIVKRQKAIDHAVHALIAEEKAPIMKRRTAALANAKKMEETAVRSKSRQPCARIIAKVRRRVKKDKKRGTTKTTQRARRASVKRAIVKAKKGRKASSRKKQ
mmetsp:Transcript_117819/g.186568  ORF Transcript_117819/g.186568 Transcript_117819/m.186568 type:complete len:445 (-) Transcript_117819:69-1403(-)